MRRRNHILRRALVLATLVGAAAGPAAAQADSIAYVKDGDVYLSTSDGARQYRVTANGGYSDVSQADDGTMIALHGVRLHRLARDGRVLADFDTPVSDTRPPGSRVFYGPFEPAISPDGTKVAYTYYYMTQTQNPNCYPPTCLVAINEGGTGYSHADRQTSWDEPGFHKHSGWRHPAWVDNGTTLLSNPTHLPNADVVVDMPGNRGKTFMAQNWFSDAVEGNPHVSGGDVTRDERKLAFVTGENDKTLTLYAINGVPRTFKDGEADPSTRPAVCYRYGDAAGGTFGTPSFSPDGTKLLWADAEGIKVVDVPSFAGGCTTTGASPSGRVLVAGGSQPDWGPADVPPGSGVTPGQPKPGEPGQPGQPGQPKPGEPKPGEPKPGQPNPTTGKRPIAARITTTTVRSALRSGIAVKVTPRSAGRVVVKVRLGSRLLATVTRSVKGSRAQTLRVRLSAKARRTLAASRAPRLSVQVGHRPTGAKSEHRLRLTKTLRRR